MSDKKDPTAANSGELVEAPTTGKSRSSDGKRPRKGRGAYGKRQDARRPANNASQQADIHAKLSTALSPASKPIWKPLFGCFPGATYVVLNAVPAFIDQFWRRLFSVAARPLAIQMQTAGARARYMKCVLQSLYVRLISFLKYQSIQ